MKAECYYSILNVSQDATSEDIKKAYRSLALIWHPDKNPAPEANPKFQAILKAYETLSDSRERDWYDRHKDQILTGKDSNDETAKYTDLFPYFSSACYSNVDDSDDGFFNVYKNVFEKLSEEEKTLSFKPKSKKSQENNRILFPAFGNSMSNYDDIVGPFYAFWSCFCTSLTFDYLDKYNTTEAENRRVLRAMEKENKKLREPARKERNDKVRALVEFIKKRDPRVKARKELIEEKNRLNREKTAEKQRQQREKFRQTANEYKPCGAFDEIDDLEEQLRQLEAEYQTDPEE